MADLLASQAFVAIVSIIAIAIIVVIRCCIVLRAIHNPDSQTRRAQERQHKDSHKPIKTVVVLGSGGHTTEMLHMVQQLIPSDTRNSTKHYDPIIYMIAETDTTSEQRLHLHLRKSNHTNPTILRIPRSREVGQSYASSIATTCWSLWKCLWIMASVRPQLILSNGPGTCLPICLAGFFWRLLGVSNTRIVFIESYCRVQTLSLTGRLLYPIADLFIVHWDFLRQKYPRSHRVSTFVL
mmetsp:Transcript_6376/g.17376  ORF Transcript_6376/g.17376 Transcript_6376/m.17376 type:complete len:238 (-) Transcript_6376:162-875(-)